MAIAIICGFALGCSLAGLFFGGLALIKVIAFEKSTHKIEYMPIDPNSANDFAKHLVDQVKDEQMEVEL
jgi:hypothetical protein